MSGFMSGGCQCGAVRFRAAIPLGRASLCHCRMCQKAFGGFYAPLVSVGEGGLAWTRGQPSWFQSSNHVRRGFCSACGTPLAYDAPVGLNIAIGAFDEPEKLAPEIEFGTEGKLSYTDRLHLLPTRQTPGGAVGYLATIVSNQHPDHDTQSWPQEREQ
ncbi:aldehyde-activating protein [Terrihabitans soli]|uniref:Aldehyde-activating protein n=1 Tax=Terrihabitans soli TaxID=708113 RepID=A0A6S6QR02_9HYPH|nr:GFA family protein [Terrihabitans soli]BCJ90397.1 aldehyde-activating protein [Terrihabitans soli]